MIKFGKSWTITVIMTFSKWWEQNENFFFLRNLPKINEKLPKKLLIAKLTSNMYSFRRNKLTLYSKIYIKSIRYTSIIQDNVKKKRNWWKTAFVFFWRKVSKAQFLNCIHTMEDNEVDDILLRLCNTIKKDRENDEELHSFLPKKTI